VTIRSRSVLALALFAAAMAGCEKPRPKAEEVALASGLCISDKRAQVLEREFHRRTISTHELYVLTNHTLACGSPNGFEDRRRVARSYVDELVRRGDKDAVRVLQ
jgi:hypothetical protein